MPKELKMYCGYCKTAANEEKLVVISAMGKTTNALEEVVNEYLEKRQLNDSSAAGKRVPRGDP